MQCSSPIVIYNKSELRQDVQKFEVPCGKCLGCLISRGREWSARVLHELESWSCASFITLTYSDRHLPYLENKTDTSTLVKSHLQKFFKRLRKAVQAKKITSVVSPLNHGNKKYKYFACGEYGEKQGRPHYHCIVFGLDINDHEWTTDHRGYKMLISGPAFDAWSYGLINIGDVNTDSITYVAKYLSKTMDFDYKSGRERPFQLISNGLGLDYCMIHAEQLIEQCGFTVFGQPQGLSRYYQKKLNLDRDVLIKRSIIKRTDLIKNLIINRNITSIAQFNEEIRKARKQAQRNLQAKTNLKKLSKTGGL